nr:MAG TPA: Protein of unknown function (DUF3966) [Caudoviricetes sp.]
MIVIIGKNFQKRRNLSKLLHYHFSTPNYIYVYYLIYCYILLYIVIY